MDRNKKDAAHFQQPQPRLQHQPGDPPTPEELEVLKVYPSLSLDTLRELGELFGF